MREVTDHRLVIDLVQVWIGGRQFFPARAQRILVAGPFRQRLPDRPMQCQRPRIRIRLERRQPYGCPHFAGVIVDLRLEDQELLVWLRPRVQ